MSATVSDGESIPQWEERVARRSVQNAQQLALRGPVEAVAALALHRRRPLRHHSLRNKINKTKQYKIKQ